MFDKNFYYTSYGCMGYIGNDTYIEFATVDDYYDYLEGLL